MTPAERADLAESMVPVACDLACRVRDGDAEGVARMAEARGWDAETTALCVVLAAMVPVDDASPNVLLAWTDGLEAVMEWRQAQLPLPAPGASRDGAVRDLCRVRQARQTRRAC